MGKIFREDSPIMCFFSDLGDQMLVNILFVICSLPIITMGCSITASFKVSKLLVDKKGCRVSREFFRAFRENFKQSTLLWCIALAAFAILYVDYVLAMSNDAPVLGIWLTAAFILCLMFVAVLCYAFPLISRYNNSLWQHVKNAAILAAGNLIRTAVLMVLSLLPVALFVMYPGVCFRLLPFWVLILFAMFTRFAVGVINPIFTRIEDNQSTQ